MGFCRISPTVIRLASALAIFASAAQPVAAQVPPASDTFLAPAEQALIDMTNTDRAQNGLAPLSFDPALLPIARERAAAQTPNAPLSHYDSQGQLVFAGLLADDGVSYSRAGENLARTFGGDGSTIARLNEALMNSPTHRANILEPSFDLVAVGAATGPDGRLAIAEIFRSDI